MVKAYEYTKVSEGETKGDIIRIIAKYGGKLEDMDERVPGRVVIMMRSNHTQPRFLRILLALPVGVTKVVEQTRRRKWRALYNFIKSALVAVDEGIMLFDQAFLAWIIGKNGKTVFETSQELELLLPPPSDGPLGQLPSEPFH